MNIAVILAAGSSIRTNSETPKQFSLVNNIPLFMYSVDAFLSVEEINEIYLVCSKEYLDFAAKYFKNPCKTRLKSIILGGSTRQESVKNAIDFLYENHGENDVILIHDSARPFVSKGIILENLSAIRKCDAITTADNVYDTVIESENNLEISEYKNREKLYVIQTPQTFKLKTIYEAHKYALENNIEATDDTKLVKQQGKEIQVVKGSRNNFKVTTKEDLELAKILLKK